MLMLSRLLSVSWQCHTTFRHNSVDVVTSVTCQLVMSHCTLCCVPITSCKRCARLSQRCKPFHSRSHWEFPICTSGEVETVFLIQFAPLGKRWRRFTENLILSLFNFNFVQRALVPGTRGLPMHRHCWCGVC